MLIKKSIIFDDLINIYSIVFLMYFSLIELIRKMTYSIQLTQGQITSKI